MKYDKKELETHDFEFLMNMLREEYPFKSRYWYEWFETKEDVINELLKANDNDLDEELLDYPDEYNRCFMEMEIEENQ